MAKFSLAELKSKAVDAGRSIKLLTEEGNYTLKVKGLATCTVEGLKEAVRTQEGATIRVTQPKECVGKAETSPYLIVKKDWAVALVHCYASEDGTDGVEDDK